MQQNKELAIFQTSNGSIEIRTDTKNATVWLSQSDLSVVFEKDQSVISRHIKNIFKEVKASHLLYFFVKNHPFNDGNKRSGAFAFIWLLQKAN